VTNMTRIRRVLKTEYCGGCCEGHSTTIGWKHDNCNILIKVRGSKKPKIEMNMER